VHELAGALGERLELDADERLEEAGVDAELPADWAPQDALSECCVVLVRPSGQVNIGLASRLCANVGVLDLRVVAPECAVLSPESRRFAVGARRSVLERAKVRPREGGLAPPTPAPQVFAKLEEAVADRELVVGTSGIKAGPSSAVYQTPEQLSTRLTRGLRAAIVFGSELDGLTRTELSMCNSFVHIPTRGPYASYNLSHAVAVIMYTLARVDARCYHRAAASAD
jgi:tRNA/rRNA methyltransferase